MCAGVLCGCIERSIRYGIVLNINTIVRSVNKWRYGAMFHAIGRGSRFDPYPPSSVPCPPSEVPMPMRRNSHAPHALPGPRSSLAKARTWVARALCSIASPLDPVASAMCRLTFELSFNVERQRGRSGISILDPTRS